MGGRWEGLPQSTSTATVKDDSRETQLREGTTLGAAEVLCSRTLNSRAFIDNSTGMRGSQAALGESEGIEMRNHENV